MIPLTIATIDASPEAWCSAESLSGGKGLVNIWGATQSYNFTCLPEQMGRRTLSVAAHFFAYGGAGEKKKLVQIVMKCVMHIEDK